GRRGWRDRRIGARRCAGRRRHRRRTDGPPRVGTRRGHGPQGMKVDVAIESGAKKSFATAVDWPGWSRSGKTEDAAVESLVAYATRYAPIARAAGETFDPDKIDIDVVGQLEGGGGTDFGVPDKVKEQDYRPTTAAQGQRLADLVEAAWQAFDATAKQAQ